MIERKELPQIPREKYKEFIQYLESHGIPCKAMKISVAKLKPIQGHVNRGKVDKFKEDPSALTIPIITSKEGLILDGHHRFIAQRELNPSGEMTCIVPDCGIRELVKLGNEFEGVEHKTVYETTIHSRHLFDPEDSTSLMVRKPLRPVV